MNIGDNLNFNNDKVLMKLIVIRWNVKESLRLLCFQNYLMDMEIIHYVILSENYVHAVFFFVDYMHKNDWKEIH